MRRLRGRRGLIGPLALAVLFASGAGVAYATHTIGMREQAIHVCYNLKKGVARVVQDPTQCTSAEGVVDLATYDELHDTAAFVRPLTYTSHLADQWAPGDEGENQVAILPIGDADELGLVHELALLPEDMSGDHTWLLSADLTLTNPREQPRALVVCNWLNSSAAEGTWTTLPATESGGAEAEYHVSIHVTDIGFAVPGEDEGVFRLYCGTFGDTEGVFAHSIHLSATRTFSPHFPDEE